MGDPNTGEIYRDTIRRPDDVGLNSETANRLRTQPVEARLTELQDIAEQRNAAKPDLRTLDGALSYLSCHEPTPDTLPRHLFVNTTFRVLMEGLWNHLPDGPGKTVAIRAIGRARMECNSCIANGGV